MIPKRNKFSSRDFANKSLFKNSKKVVVPYGYFSILTPPSLPLLRGGTQNKKGIILSKKNFKTAVLRNKFKRLFYNTLLEVQKEKKEFLEISFIFHPNKLFSKEELVIDLKKIVL